jgi:hypothetical protein
LRTLISLVQSGIDRRLHPNPIALCYGAAAHTPPETHGPRIAGY